MIFEQKRDQIVNYRKRNLLGDNFYSKRNWHRLTEKRETETEMKSCLHYLCAQGTAGYSHIHNMYHNLDQKSKINSIEGNPTL